MRKHKRRRNKNKIILIGMFSLLLFFSIGYAAFQTNITLTAKGNIKDKSRVIQAWSPDATTDFHNEAYKANIINVTFLDSSFVPSNAIESWDVSQAKDKGVMAYVTANEVDNTKYDLFIGAKDGVIANSNSSYLFYMFTNTEIIDFKDNFDTSNVTNMGSMFSGHNDETGIHVMSLAEIKGLENFDTSNVTSMHRMFLFDVKLTHLNLSSFNTSNVRDMSYMFNHLDSMKTIDLSNFDTGKVTSMQNMFRGSGFVNLDLSNFDTSNVTNMESMFFDDRYDDNDPDHSPSLISLNLCGWNTANVTNMNNMFTYNPILKNIYVDEGWNTSKATTVGMFYLSGVSSVTTGMCDQIMNKKDLH